MEHQVHGAHRFVHAVGNGQPGPGDLTTRVRYTRADGFPGGADGVNDIGTGCTKDGFSLGYPGLDEGTVTQQCGGTG